MVIRTQNPHTFIIIIFSPSLIHHSLQRLLFHYRELRHADRKSISDLATHGDRILGRGDEKDVQKKSRTRQNWLSTHTAYFAAFSTLSFSFPFLSFSSSETVRSKVGKANRVFCQQGPVCMIPRPPSCGYSLTQST